MYKLILFILLILFLLIGIPILFEYYKNKTMKYIYDSGNKRKKHQKQLNYNINTANPLYLKAKNLFNIGMKSRSLKREDILNLIDLLEKMMGTHVKVYKNFKFSNDCHKVYVYLKSKEISIVDMQKVVKFLEQRLA